MSVAVMVHGSPETPRTWDRIVAALYGDARTILTPGLPGFAEPAPADFPATKEAYVEWLIDMLRPLAAEHGPVHLVGHDWGSLIGLRVASLHSELLASLAVGAGAIDPDLPLHPLFRTLLQPGEGERFMGDVTQSSAVERLTGLGVPPEAAEHNAYGTPGAKEVMLRLYRSASTFAQDWAPDLRHISVPTLLIWGERDVSVPIEYGRRMAARIGADLLALDSGHFWTYEHPDAVARALCRLWDRVDLPHRPAA